MRLLREERERKRGESEREGERGREKESWCFEPSQPLRITSGLRVKETERETDRQADRRNRQTGQRDREKVR